MGFAARLGKYLDRLLSLSRREAGTHGSAAANVSSSCSVSPAIIGSCGDNGGPRLFAGKLNGLIDQRFLPSLCAQPILPLELLDPDAAPFPHAATRLFDAAQKAREVVLDLG